MSSASPPSESFSATRLTELLAPTLGWEKSAEVVGAALARLGLPQGVIAPAEAFSVLDALAQTPGMVGIAARFARTRVDVPRVSTTRPRIDRSALPVPDPATPPSSRDVPSSRVNGTQKTLAAHEIAALFAGAMGKEKGEEVVLGAARRLGLPVTELDKAQALLLLDDLAAEPGIVGLCARFAKARLILRFAA
jgi:hypothetical protein